MQCLIELYNKTKKNVIGLMSGTSLDGIDAALIKILNSGKDTEIELIKFLTVPYPNELRELLLEISMPGKGAVDEICRINFLLAEYYVDVIIHLCAQTGLYISELDLIGSHGQTVHHLPATENIYGKDIRGTLQLGEPSVIAKKTGVVTVGNFRSGDLAVGGQGAPLVPYFDFLMFASEEYNRVLLNIGGIANITVLPKKVTSDHILAFDTGPGNMVINSLIKKLYNKEFDKDGEIAGQGRLSVELLKKLNQFHYFEQAVPKSTGREDFGETFVEEIISESDKLNLSAEDVITTATELTAVTISNAMEFTNLSTNQVDQLIVSGGGAHNKYLMKSLKEKFSKSEVILSDDFDIPVDGKEAICFAVLANETIQGNPTNLPSVTGAKQKTVLGTISLP